MGIITALVVQKRNANRINVYLDGCFAFGLNRINSAWLKVGQELSNEKINELQMKDENDQAMQTALQYLSYRNRSEQEVVKKMSDKGFAQGKITTVIQELKTRNYLSDRSFAREWVESRVANKPRSRRMLIYELRQKKVGEEDIQVAMENLESEDELAFKALSKISGRLTHLDKADFFKKTTNYLYGRGFSFDVIRKISKQLWQKNNQESNQNSNK